MSHFAKIKNGIVEQVLVIDQEQIDTGNWGEPSSFVQTSYNTRGGKHLLGGTPLRKNYAGIGDTYDKEKDAFIAPQPFPSWTLNEATCLWEAPIPRPQKEQSFVWNEEKRTWEDKTYLVLAGG